MRRQTIYKTAEGKAKLEFEEGATHKTVVVAAEVTSNG